MTLRTGSLEILQCHVDFRHICSIALFISMTVKTCRCQALKNFIELKKSTDLICEGFYIRKCLFLKYLTCPREIHGGMCVGATLSSIFTTMKVSLFKALFHTIPWSSKFCEFVFVFFICFTSLIYSLVAVHLRFLIFSLDQFTRLGLVMLSNIKI